MKMICNQTESMLVALNEAVINRVTFTWLKEFNQYFNGKEWIKK